MSSGEYIMDVFGDDCNSLFEHYIKLGLFNIEEVKDLLNKRLITQEDYNFAVEYLTEV